MQLQPAEQVLRTLSVSYQKKDWRGPGPFGMTPTVDFFDVFALETG